MATDQEIRDAGFKYIPQQKYLQNPFQIPVAPAPPPPASGGITNTNVFANSGGGGDGFSVYNADPNTITNMNPNMNALQDARYDNELSYVGRTLPGDSSPLYSTNTEAMKNMEMNPDYYGMDTIGDRFELDEKGQLVMDSEGNYIRKNQPSKISQLLSKGIGFIPGIGTLSKFGNFAAGLLPVNRRAVMENQLGTQGVMVNDIGQIVVGQGGQYNTPEGIMAGYNVSAMDDETFTGRQKNIGETLKDKYGLTQTQVDDLISGKLTEEDFTDSKYNLKGTNKTSNLFTNIRNIEIARKNFNNTTDTTDQIVDIKTDTKTNNQNQGNNDGRDNTPAPQKATETASYANENSYESAAYGGDRNDGQGHSPGSQENSPGHPSNRANGGLMYARGGRAGYFYGGRVSVMKGGLASIL